MSEPEPLLLFRSGSEGVCRVTLTAAAGRSPLGTPVLQLIMDVLDHVRSDDAVRCVVIAGSWNDDAVGTDPRSQAKPDTAPTSRSLRSALWANIRNFPKPIIAAVEGHCVGAGNELLMCCDLAVAGNGAIFAISEAALENILGEDSTAILPQIIGRMATMRMVLLGEPVDCHTAQRLGLIVEIVEDGTALKRAEELAAAVAARPSTEVCKAKALVKASFALPFTAYG